MKIYIAGYGHKIEQTKFINIRNRWNMLLSYFYLSFKDGKTTGMFGSRYEWIKEQNDLKIR